MTVPANLKDKDGIVAVNDRDMLIQSAESAQEIGYTISIIVSVIAIVLGTVVLYNLGVLSYIEKVREIATMKVLGFQSMNIRFILMQQNLTVTGLGAIIGVPLGYLSLTALLDAFLLDDSDLIMDLSLLPFVVAIIGTFLVSVLINIVVTAKVNEINMVEALKGVE